MKNSIFLLVFLLLASSININSQWVQMNNGMGNPTVRSLAFSGGNIFAGTIERSIYLSTNSGTNWTQTFLNHGTVYSLAINGNYIFAGTTYDVYLSTNNGITWTSTGLSRIVISLGVNGKNVFAGTSGNGVFVSTNNGSNWTYAGLGSLNVLSLAVNSNNVFAGTSPNGVYLSTNNGANWIQTSLNNRSIYSLAVNGNNVYAGTSGYGVYQSTNNGITWTQLFNGGFISALTVNGNNIFAGSHQYGVYMSTNNGANWMYRNEGLPVNTYVYAFCIFNNYIFAGTSINTTGSGVYRRPLGELVGIKPISSEIPKEFSLEQNYPNPFNPTTHFEFRIADFGFVKLVVFDVLGRKIETIVNEQLKSGTYEADFDGTNYPSGVYYYKLTSGDFTDAKKMVLIK